MRISDWSSDVCSSDLCYLGYEAQPEMLAAYEDRTPVDETRLAPTGDDPVVAGLYRAMAKQGTILDATGSLFVKVEAARKAAPTAKPLRCSGARTIRLTQQAWRAGFPIATGTDIDTARQTRGEGTGVSVREELRGRHHR